MAAEFLGESLIFLISQPRAGSTLLQRILAGHPLIHTSAEPWLMLHPVYALKQEGLQAEYEAGWARTALLDFLANYADGTETYLQAVRAFASVLYGRALAGTGKRFFLDKTPRYYFIIPELRTFFPRARFVFLIRNPLAVLASILATWVQGDWAKLTFYRYDLLLAPQRILEGIKLLSDKAIVVKYEELVTTPSETIDAVCRQLGLHFSDNMLNYGRRPAPRGAFGDPGGVDRHMGPTPDSVNSWQELSATPQARHFAHAYLHELGPELIAALGYQWQELEDGLGDLQKPKATPLVSWRTTMRARESWTLRERLSFEWAMALQREGALCGMRSFGVRCTAYLARSFRPTQPRARTSHDGVGRSGL